MAELADAPDLGSGGEILVGSSPSPGSCYEMLGRLTRHSPLLPGGGRALQYSGFQVRSVDALIPPEASGLIIGHDFRSAGRTKGRRPPWEDPSKKAIEFAEFLWIL
jgi:hypothetical protein